MNTELNALFPPYHLMIDTNEEASSSDPQAVNRTVFREERQDKKASCSKQQSTSPYKAPDILW